MEETVKLLTDESLKVNPYGMEIFGFLVLILVVYGSGITWALIRTTKKYEELATKSVEVMTLFIHENTGERVREKRLAGLTEMKEVIRDVVNEVIKGIRD